MKQTHHPSDATLMAFGSGSLPEALALVVVCHLRACPECLAKIRLVETLGGVLLDQLPPAAMGANVLADTLKRLETAPSSAARDAGEDTENELEPEQEWLPEPLRHYRLRRWRRIAPGVRQCIVVPRRPGGSSARLLRVEPMTSLPNHGHSGPELTCVLLGSFSDGGRRFAVNDISEIDEAVHHSPVSNQEGCTCLIATTGPWHFRGLFGWLIQLFLDS